MNLEIFENYKILYLYKLIFFKLIIIFKNLNLNLMIFFSKFINYFK